MSDSVDGSHAEFDDLNRRGHELVAVGQLEQAVAIFDEMLEWAQRRGASALLDLAICNRAAVMVQLGRGESEVARLRRILVRGADPVCCRLAAYHIARHYDLIGNHEKALFYARIARERAEQLGRKDWVASSHNLMGESLLAQSFIAEAAREFEAALGLMPEELSVWRACILNNLGYCQVLQGRFDEGYRLHYQSLAILRRF